MEVLFLLLWFGFMATIVVYSLFIQPRKDEARIRAYLAAQGASQIGVSQKWFGGSKYYRAYDVTYADRSAARHTTVCMVHASLWGEAALFWQEGLALADQRSGPENSPGTQTSQGLRAAEGNYTALPSSPKDKLISQLLDENKKLRRALGASSSPSQM